MKNLLCNISDTRRFKCVSYNIYKQQLDFGGPWNSIIHITNNNHWSKTQMLKELGKVDNILGFDNNVTNICNNRTIVLLVNELALLLVMVAVELMYFSLDCYKLVVLD